MGRAAAGFTLVEVLAGMAIFVLIAGTAYTALRSAGRIWEAVDARSQADGEVRLAIGYLRRHLSSAFPLAVREGDRWWFWFEGKGDRVTFVAEGSRHIGLTGLYEMTVAHDTSSQPPGLVLSLRGVDRRLRAGEAGEQPVRRVLVENAAEAEFTFFGRRGGNGEAAWYPEWRRRQSLPELVRLRLRSAAAGDWPALTVRLAARGPRFLRAESREDP